MKTDDALKSIISEYRRLTGLECIYLPAENVGTFPMPDCRFCAMVLGDGKGKEECGRRRRAAIARAGAETDTQIFSCLDGLTEWIVPVNSEGNITGYLVSGFAIPESDLERIAVRSGQYCEKYRISKEEFSEIVEESPHIEAGMAKVYAQLLSSLTAIKIPSGSRTEIPAVNDVVFFTGNGQGEALRHPLSYYIFDFEGDSEAIDVFWQVVEVKASQVFANVMSGRYTEAKEEFIEIMQMAYSESDLSRAKISAEMLFHIIFLKYYRKDIYDIRFYRLAFIAVRELMQAKLPEEIPLIMESCFDRLYAIYNSGEAPKSNGTQVKAIMEYIDNNYKRDIRIEDIASAVYLSTSYMSRLFKKETSFTIKWYLNSVRMQHAQELLLNTRMPVKDIAEAVGYHNLRSFYKMFEKHFGVTCGEMRKRFSPFN